MKILMLAPFPVPYPRGSSLKAMENAEMAAESPEVEKITLVSYGSPIKNTEKRIDLQPISILYTSTGFSFKRIFCMLLLLLKAFHMEKKNRYDIIHAHNTESGILAIILKRIFGIPVLLDLHGDLKSELMASKTPFKGLVTKIACMVERQVLTRADMVVTLTGLWEAELKAKGISNVEAIYPTSRIIKPRADTAPLKKRLGIGQNSVVMYSGNFSEYQGLDLIIAASKGVIQKRKNVRFVLIGKDPDKRYERITKSLGIHSKFIFTGFLPKELLPSYYKMADVLVIPRPDSSIARFVVPKKLTDYMASGRPIVATDVGDHKTMLSGAGVLVKPSADGLADGILSILENKRLGQSLGKRAYDRLVERYSWESVRKKTIQTYKSILANK